MIRVPVACVVIAVGVPLALPASAAAQEAEGISIRLLDAPTDRSDDPRAQLYVVDHVASSSVVERRVEVVNHTEQPVHVDLYAGAAFVDGSGFGFGDAAGGNELADWTTVAPAAMRLDPDAAGVAIVRVAVPAGAAEGERYGVIWAGTSDVAANDVRTVNRVGIRMYLSVGDNGEPDSGFAITGLGAGRDDQGRPTVIADISNTGARALDLGGHVDLHEGPGGTVAGPFPITGVPTLAIGATTSITVPLEPSLPPGPWMVRVVLRSGSVERTSEALFTFPADEGAIAPATPDEARPAGRLAAGLTAGASAICVLAALAWHTWSVAIATPRSRRRSAGTVPARG